MIIPNVCFFSISVFIIMIFLSAHLFICMRLENKNKQHFKKSNKLILLNESYKSKKNPPNKNRITIQKKKDIRNDLNLSPSIASIIPSAKSIFSKKNTNETKTNINKCTKIMINYYDNLNMFSKNFFIPFNQNLNVKKVKEQIEQLYGIPIIFQELLYENKPLNDDLLLSELITEKNLKLLNMRLITILPHIFDDKIKGEKDKKGEIKEESESESEIDKSNTKKEKGDTIQESKKMQNLKELLRYHGLLTLLKEYTTLINKIEADKYMLNNKDIISNFHLFNEQLEKQLQKNNLSLNKIKKEMEKLKYEERKKLLLRLNVDYPLLSNKLIERIQQLFNFYYLGDIKSAIKFSLFFFVLYKYANYPTHIKKFFLGLSIFVLIVPLKPFYNSFHLLLFSFPRMLLYPGFTNILSASYQQILECA